jgi:hypothetical protein
MVLHGHMSELRRVLGAIDTILDLSNTLRWVIEQEVEPEPLSAEIEAVDELMPLLVQELRLRVRLRLRLVLPSYCGSW